MYFLYKLSIYNFLFKMIYKYDGIDIMRLTKVKLLNFPHLLAAYILYNKK